MKTSDYTTTILADQTPEEAYNAIKNFRAWWSEEIEGNTDKINEVFFYHYRDTHLCKLKLIEVVPDKKLVYQVLDNEFTFNQDKTEWINTKLIFQISRDGDKTKIQFTHQGLVPQYECYKVCFDAWNTIINKSLYILITTGKGDPLPLEGGGFISQLAKRWQLQ